MWQQALCSLSFTGYKTAMLENKRRTGTEKAKSSLHLAWLVLCLSSPSASLALQYGGFVPREWLRAKGLLPCKKAVDSKHAEPSQGYLVCAALQTVTPILSLFPLRVGTFIVQFSAILLRNLRRGSQKKTLTQLPRIVREQIQLYSINTSSNTFHSSAITRSFNP